jgi:hypothetical protein
MADTLDLFSVPAAAPEGFRYHSDLIDAEQERDLTTELQTLSFTPFQFQGFEGKRRVMPLRQAAAACFKLPASALQQVLLTHYPAGATIGWHKDRPVFFRMSLASRCYPPANSDFAATRGQAGTAIARSGTRCPYLLQGPARLEWDHSIPAVAERRYSITFRTLRDAPQEKEPA